MSSPLVGDKNAPIIPDSAITASSVYGADNLAHDSRKHGKWWATKPDTENAWLQWNLGEVSRISSVWTASDSLGNGVQAYALSYSNDAQEWVAHPGYFRHDFSNLRAEGTTLQVNPPIVAKWVKLHVRERTLNAPLTVELLGSRLKKDEIRKLRAHSHGAEDLVRKQILEELDQSHDSGANLTKMSAGTCHGMQLPRTLKFQFNGCCYRVLVNITARCGYEDIKAAMERAIGQSIANLRVTYVDEEGDRCVLNAATFSDLLWSMQTLSEYKGLVKLEVETCLSKSTHDYDWHKGQPSNVVQDEEAGTEEREDDSDAYQQADEAIDDEYQIVGRSGRCYVKRTLLPTPDGDYKTVSTLQVGDYVLGSNSQQLEIIYKKEHGRNLHKLTTFRTATAELTVTTDHRVVVRGSAGLLEKPAASLELDDVVICGSKPQRVTKVMKFEQRVDVIELHFKPDESVLTLMANQCGILTKGGREHLDRSLRNQCGLCFATRPLGPLGPYTFEAVESHEPRRRARSCDR